MSSTSVSYRPYNIKQSVDSIESDQEIKKDSIQGRRLLKLCNVASFEKDQVEFKVIKASWCAWAGHLIPALFQSLLGIFSTSYYERAWENFSGRHVVVIDKRDDRIVQIKRGLATPTSFYFHKQLLSCKTTEELVACLKTMSKAEQEQLKGMIELGNDPRVLQCIASPSSEIGLLEIYQAITLFKTNGYEEELQNFVNWDTSGNYSAFPSFVLKYLSDRYLVTYSQEKATDLTTQKKQAGHLRAQETLTPSASIPSHELTWEMAEKYTGKIRIIFPKDSSSVEMLPSAFKRGGSETFGPFDETSGSTARFIRECAEHLHNASASDQAEKLSALYFLFTKTTFFSDCSDVDAMIAKVKHEDLYQVVITLIKCKVVITDELIELISTPSGLAYLKSQLDKAEKEKVPFEMAPFNNPFWQKLAIKQDPRADLVWLLIQNKVEITKDLETFLLHSDENYNAIQQLMESKLDPCDELKGFLSTQHDLAYLKSQILEANSRKVALIRSPLNNPLFLKLSRSRDEDVSAQPKCQLIKDLIYNGVKITKEIEQLLEIPQGIDFLRRRQFDDKKILNNAVWQRNVLQIMRELKISIPNSLHELLTTQDGINALLRYSGSIGTIDEKWVTIFKVWLMILKASIPLTKDLQDLIAERPFREIIIDQLEASLSSGTKEYAFTNPEWITGMQKIRDLFYTGETKKLFSGDSAIKAVQVLFKWMPALDEKALTETVKPRLVCYATDEMMDKLFDMKDAPAISTPVINCRQMFEQLLFWEKSSSPIVEYARAFMDSSRWLPPALKENVVEFTQMMYAYAQIAAERPGFDNFDSVKKLEKPITTKEGLIALFRPSTSSTVAADDTTRITTPASMEPALGAGAGAASGAGATPAKKVRWGLDLLSPFKRT